MQPITKRFVRSIYISLGFACACLGYAELEFIPAISIFTVVVLILLFLAYRLEGRWALSLRAANVIGGAIGIVMLIWVVGQFSQQDKEFADEITPASARLPYLGPLLMILVPAKLFRPKHNGDFWGLQGIGLAAVALGCALTADPVFGVLLLAYLVSTVCSLTLFYYFRQEVRIDRPRPGGEGPRILAQAGRWATLVTAVALGLFLCTPRVTEARWEVPAAGTRLQTGVDENRPAIDLNHGGTLTVNRDRVFEVRA
ncbi:MAG TPA: transglutaminaseTgpA domain-containing protein, partial [Gemmataceae bacterium]|nr:transglutaminaseTgpA domain-containing protein [Gemmataceae bacterium]